MGILKPLLGNLKITYSALCRFFYSRKKRQRVKKTQKEVSGIIFFYLHCCYTSINCFALDV